LDATTSTTPSAAPKLDPRPESAPARPWSLLLWAVLFAVAHTQGPLFYSNQNQYLLHGLAEGGLPYLDHDWLATTRDPTPVFSALVAFTYRHLNLNWLYVDYFLLLGVYFVSLVKLCDALPYTPRAGVARFGFLTLLVAVHAAAARLASAWLLGVDYPWYFQCGVANQYILGPGLQPSAFGILLITSLAAFVHGRPALAAALVALTATLHATYLLPGAMLTLAYMHVLWWGGRRRAAVLLGAGTLVAVLPVVAYSAIVFAPTSPGQFAEAQRLIAEMRIPHHAQMSRWLDRIAAAQVAWVGLALVLVRGTKLFPVLAIPAGIGLALSVVQAATGSPGLALLFPWRVSAVLVPVATAVVLARLFGWLARLSPGPVRLAWGAFTAVLIAVTAGGVAISYAGLGYAMSQDELPLLEYVRTHKQPGDVYLIPVSVPKTQGVARGTASTTFLPPPRATPRTALIAVDLQRFRVLTGAPIYVDYKSIPYKDVDVLEWYRRLQLVQDWYKVKDWGRVRDELVREGVTHVVVPADRDEGTQSLERVYDDGVYRVYRVRRDPAAQ
jgi:hypothetical protein